jgi:hypothetical protein
MKENNNKYSTEDIRKYLDGELPDAEMQALEKAALEDPFLADAIEGFEESRRHVDSFESGVSDLKRRLSSRIKQKNWEKGIFIQMSAWQAVASLVFLTGTAVFIVTKINIKTKPANIAVSTMKDSGTFKNLAGVTVTDSSTVPSIKPPRPVNTVIASNRQTDVQANVSDKSQSRTSVSEKEGNLSKERRINAGNNKPTEPEVKILSGNLMDTDTIKEEYVEMKHKDSAGSIAPGGQMSPATTTLNDVVVLGYTTDTDRDDVDNGITGPKKIIRNKNTEPYGGWTAFDDYMNSNKKILTSDSVLKGEEIVSFEISSSGELSLFKILQSVSKSHDAEIIRLIQAGPAWKIKKGRKQKCTVVVSFK